MTINVLEPPQQDLATRIKSARKEARLSQVDLASGIGLSDKAISSYEQGRSAPPLSKLKQIARVTNLPLSYFTNTFTIQESLDTVIHDIEQELQEIKTLLKVQ